MSLTLLIGGTRSGKSARAERLAAANGPEVRYVATADGADPAMAGRIEAHRERRPADWRTVEAGDDLAEAAAGASCVLVDGLGAWIAGVMHRAGALEDPSRERLAGAGDRVEAEIRALVELSRSVELIIVAEDAGSGLLPPDAASRSWLDLLGAATQRLARAAERAELIVAGESIPLRRGGSLIPAAEQEELRHHGDRELRPGDADHAVNVLAGGPPPWLRGALDAALERDARRYPDESAARAALASLHGRDPEEIVPTNGGAEALWLLPVALRPSLAACVHPGFGEAEAALRAHGVPVARVMRDPERSFSLDPAAVPEQADLVILGNPASPSGTLDPAAAILALRRPGRIVVVDEAFMDLVPGAVPTLVGERLDDVIVVRSLTKVLAIPGLRAGYAVADARLAQRLEAARPPWSANALALAALETAARHPHELASIAERAVREREDLVGRLGEVEGVRTWPSVANFCLLEVEDGDALAARLRESGIAVRPASSFPGLDRRHVRVTARDPAANARLVAALIDAVER